MTFRLLDQAPQYLLPSGELNAGGSLSFFDTDLTTPRNTWSDPDQNTLNPNPVPLDAAGRAQYDIWLDGEYGVVLKDADGVTIWTRNNVNNGSEAGAVIPALVTGQFLTNDGSNLQWAPILQVPDPTGLANYVLTSDGTGVPIWQQIEEPEPPEDPDITVGDTSFLAGLLADPTKWCVEWGAAEAPASGSHSTSVAITFEEPFNDTPVVIPVIWQSSICPAGNNGGASISGASNSGCTINVNVNDDDTHSSYNIINPVALRWVAIGLRDVA